jgi:hypothetical protein
MIRGIRIRGIRIKGGKDGKTNTSETRTERATETPTQKPSKISTEKMSTKKQSTEMSTERSTRILQMLPIKCTEDVDLKATNAMFRTTSPRSIYKSMPIADDYRCV